MANIARGEAEYYISIEVEYQVLYFPYSMWQGNDLSIIKNFLVIIKHIVPTTLIHHVKSGWTHCFVTFTILSIAVPAEENHLKSFQFFTIHVSILYYSTVHTLWCYIYGKYSTDFAFDPPTQNSL